VVTTAVVLIKAERAAIADLGGKLADVSGISEAYSVTGEWDFVAIVRVRDAEEVAQTVTEALAAIPGVADTRTMVAFRTFSQHDLEAMFSIGM
jgi:DNA-binding Lrp family transcriptional regulator